MKRSITKNGREIEYGDVVASHGLSNWGGIAIYESMDWDDEIIIAGYNNKKPRGYRIYYTNSGRAYFNWGRMRIYLDECLRINI